MPVSPARLSAFEILLRIEREDSYATELLHSSQLEKLSSRDHGLATELVMGVLRWRSILDQEVASASSQKIGRVDTEVLAALRLGAYQLLFLSRVPARAAIFESVELVKQARKRSAASFVNAILRKIAASAKKDTLAEINQSSDTSALAANAAHPAWLVERWAQQYGLDVVRKICSHNQSLPETAIRIHSDPAQPDQLPQNKIDAELKSAGIGLAPGQLLSAARRVIASDVTATRAFREGRVSIQDEGSQLVALLIGQGNKILDCCAAPGGKTSVLAQRNPTAKVFATELHPHRARLLQDLNRSPNVEIIAADARHLPFACSFDRILADVPCSGTGTLARNPEIKWRLKEEDLHDLQVRQIDILKSALTSLAAGGRLVYSTCSLEREENEAVVDAAIVNAAVTAAPEFEVVDCREALEYLQSAGEFAAGFAITSLLSGPYLRTIPGIHPCDGFFAALIKRKE